MTDPAAAAARAQQQAADPGVHVAVTANAGSGKTRVLVDRVARLLRAGAAPERILCLTYTKAAAAEMRERLFKRLGGWAVADDAALIADLEVLEPSRPVPDPPAARALFARALETPGGLRIQTIHAFCERLLRRFPVEAGAPAGFTVLDEAEAADVAAAARLDVAGRPDLAAACGALAETAHDGALDELFAFAARERAGLDDWMTRTGGPDAAARAIAARLGVDEGERPNDAFAAAWAAVPRDRLGEAAEALAAGAKTDQQQADRIRSALSAGDPAPAFVAYSAVFLTAAGGPRARLVTKKTLEAAPWLEPFLAREADAVSAARARAQAAASARFGAAALRLAAAFAGAYDARLAARGALDFADLVTRARDLLTRADAADWVRWRLDGGVEHVLIDEAQDTSPEQWALLDAIAEEITAGAGAQGEARTVFAVGDEKQSIYSFQGARPEGFLAFNRRLITRAGSRTVAPQLSVSFRSAPAILQVVDALFAQPVVAAAMGAPFAAADAPPLDPPAHVAARADAGGCVEVWPALEAPDVEDEAADPFSGAAPAEVPDAKRRLAGLVADAVRDLLDAKEGVGARGPAGWRRRAARAEDVMILVRRRGPLFDQLIRALKRRGVPTAGADRMVLKDETAVADCLTAARVALAPHDDLALAELLTGPFAHPVAAASPPIDHDALFALAHPRTGGLGEALGASADPRFADARALAARVRGLAQGTGPFAFFAGLLESAAPSGETYARRLYHRLGAEAEDAIDELLTRALAFARRGGGGLLAFVAGVEGDAETVRRQLGEGAGGVRVMTVHGAKGLEAPIVILPDTVSGGAARDAPLIQDPEAGWLWRGAAKDDPPPVAAARAAAAARDRAEALRLFYVAMTRAEERLIVCGAALKRAIEPTADWRALAEGALDVCGARPVETPAGPGLRFGGDPAPADPEAAAPAAPIAAPAWLTTPVDRAGPEIMPDDPVLSPLTDQAAVRRGTLIHALLARLPELPEADRRTAGAAYLARVGGVDPAAQAAFLEEALGVMAHPDARLLFGPSARAEVPIMGRGADGARFSLRVDRLALTDREVVIGEFKTHRAPPADDAPPPAAIQAQVARYRDAVAAAFPGRAARIVLIWTSGPRVRALPQA